MTTPEDLAAQAKSLADALGDVRVMASRDRATREEVNEAARDLHAAIDALAATREPTIPEGQTNSIGALGSILHIATSETRGWNDWNYVAQICRAALSASQTAAPVIPAEGQALADELLGVIVDVEDGDGFDAVCLATIKRVCAALRAAPIPASQPQARQELTDEEIKATSRRLLQSVNERYLLFARAVIAADRLTRQPAEAREAVNPAPTLTERLQQQCSDWGTYWRAPDAHGVNLTIEQATALLARALGVEVEIAQPAREDGRDAARLDWLDKQGSAYGFEDMHEGNEWSVKGPFGTLREAIDAAMSALAQGGGND